MKKLLFIFISMFLLFNINAKAIKVELSSYIPGVYIKKSNNTETRYMQVRWVNGSLTKHFLYCIDPFIDIDPNYDYKIENGATNAFANINFDTWQRLRAASHFGYGYKNHNSDEWYAITQLVIWQIIEPNSVFYFTDTLNGNKTNKYDYMIDELYQLINDYLDVEDYYVSVNNLNHLDIYIPDSDDYRLKNASFGEIFSINHLYFKETFNGERIYNLVKGENDTILYYGGNNQRLIQSIASPIVYKNVYLTVLSGKLNINFTKDNTYSNCTSNVENIYRLTNSIGKEVMLLYPDTKSNYSLNLNLDDYTLEQISSSCNTDIDNTKYKLSLNSDSNTYDIAIKDIKGQLKINKYYCNSDKCSKESNAKFTISDNNKTFEVTTNKNGVAQITLGVGKYNLKQIEGKDNYTFIDDMELDIKNNEPINLELKNMIKKGKLNINLIENKEYYSNCNSGNNIYALYNSNNELIDYIKDSTYSKMLEYGKYYLVQVEHNCNTKEDSVKHSISLYNDTVNYDLKLKQNIKEIVITKQYCNSISCSKEKDATFNLFDDLYTEELITNRLGRVSFKIGYGTYNIKQVTGKDNYHFIEPFVIEVDNSDTLNIDLVNNIKKGTLNVNLLKDYNYYSNCSNQDNDTFTLYNDKNEVVDIINKNYSKALEYGTYYIKQTSNSCNTRLDDNTYNIELFQDDYNLDIELVENTKDIIINKEYCNNNICICEDNAIFSLGDENYKQELITNEDGYVKTTISYGNYILKQIKGIDGYKYIDDLDIEVSDDKRLVLNLKNNKIVEEVIEPVKEETKDTKVVETPKEEPIEEEPTIQDLVVKEERNEDTIYEEVVEEDTNEEHFEELEEVPNTLISDKPILLFLILGIILYIYLILV